MAPPLRRRNSRATRGAPRWWQKAARDATSGGGAISTSSGGVRNGAQGVGLAAAAPATHGQHREAFACTNERDDLPRLLEADVDLHRQTGRAETTVVAREHTAHG